MKQLTENQFRAHMKKLKIPLGFVGDFEEDQWGFGENATKYLKFVMLKPDDTKITFDQSGGGHTEFKVDSRGWLTFDRTGVGDSFRHLPYDFEKKRKFPSLNDIVKEQLERINKRREYYKTAVKIPGLKTGHTVSPEGVPVLKDRLQKCGQVSFMPAGFGTGLTVTKKRPDAMTLRYGGARAPQELEEFLGHSPLWITTFDAD